MELPWEVPQQLRRVLHHPMLKQLLWLLLWACMSLSAIYANRVLVHYHDFAAPWFLALMSAGAVAIAARLLVFLTAADDGSSGKDWLHLCLTGVIMWASVVLNIASLRTLPVPMILLIQASGPSFSYWLAVLLQQEEPQWSQSLKALLVFCSSAAAVLPHHAAHSTTGLLLQGSAVLLDTLWQRLHLRAVINSTSTSSSTDPAKPFSGLVLLADVTPAAVVLLLPALFKFDMYQWEVQQYRLRSQMPEAILTCMLVCCLMVLKAQPPVMQGLTAEPTGPLARVARDAVLGLVAAKLLNEHLSALQWLAYGVAQAATVALWAGSSGAGGSSKRVGFTRLPPVLG